MVSPRAEERKEGGLKFQVVWFIVKLGSEGEGDIP